MDTSPHFVQRVYLHFLDAVCFSVDVKFSIPAGWRIFIQAFGRGHCHVQAFGDSGVVSFNSKFCIKRRIFSKKNAICLFFFLQIPRLFKDSAGRYMMPINLAGWLLGQYLSKQKVCQMSIHEA